MLLLTPCGTCEGNNQAVSGVPGRPGGAAGIFLWFVQLSGANRAEGPPAWGATVLGNVPFLEADDFMNEKCVEGEASRVSLVRASAGGKPGKGLSAIEKPGDMPVSYNGVAGIRLAELLWLKGTREPPKDPRSHRWQRSAVSSRLTT